MLSALYFEQQPYLKCSVCFEYRSFSHIPEMLILYTTERKSKNKKKIVKKKKKKKAPCIFISSI